MAKKGKKAKKSARTAPAKLVTLKRAPKDAAASEGQPTPKGAKRTPGADTQGAAGPGTALARITELETERTNLMAQVAWARGVAQEQQKALEVERQRAEKLTAELETQRARVEALKALGPLDRLLGRHKRI